MGVEISAGYLLTTCKLKDTDATFYLHIDQYNVPSAVQISIVANKEIKKLNQRTKNEGLIELDS